MEAGGSLRSPQRRGGGRPAAGRPAAGHLVKVRPAAGLQGTRRDAELSRELPPVPPTSHPANNLPGLGDPPPLPRALPGVPHPPQAEPRRAVSRSPSSPDPLLPTGSARPGTAFPHPPPFREETFPSQLPAPPEPRCPPRGGGGDGVGLRCRDPPAPYGEQVRKASRQAGGESPEPAAPAEVTPPLTSQAARLGSARLGGRLGGQRPPGLGANRALPLFQPRDTGAPAPPPAVPPGPCLRSTPVAVGQLRRDSRLPLRFAGLLIQLTGGRRRRAGSAQAGGAGGGGRAGRAAQAPAAVPPLRRGGWGLSSPWGGPAVPGRVAPPLVGGTGRQPCEELPLRVMLGPTPSWPFFQCCSSDLGL